MDWSEGQAFLSVEARLLDERDLESWLALTSEDFVYWIPVNTADADPRFHLSILYEDRGECAERIYRIMESGLNHSQDPPSNTVRFVSNIEVQSDDSEAVLRCNTLLYEYRSGSSRRDSLNVNVYPSRCEYLLRKSAGSWLMARKKLVLCQLDGPLDAMTFFP